LRTSIFFTFKPDEKYMGRAYTYRCDRCGYEARFNEGHGYLVRRQPLESYLENKKVIFHHKTHKVLNQLAGDAVRLTVDAGFKIYRCPHCRLLYEKVEVKVLDDQKILHKSEFRCHRCRARLKLTNIHRLKKAACPSCKGDTFRFVRRQLVLWD
jgi:DNA-directed RNA polymerase subunit RPC12/RpoP